MSYPKYFLLIAVSLISNLIYGQKKTTILVSICVQNASNYNHVTGANLIIDKLDINGKAVESDSMPSEVALLKHLDINYRYRIRAQKEGFNDQDTILIPPKDSRIYKQRVGIYMHPIVCFTIRGNVYTGTLSSKIKKGKVVIKDLYTQKTEKIEIKDGRFSFCGKCLGLYEVTVMADNYLETTRKVKLNSQNCVYPQNQSLNLNIELFESYNTAFFAGESLVLDHFTFVGNTTTLTTQGERELRKLIKVMLKNPELRFSLAVYANPFQDRKFNRRLAEYRARLIEQKMILGGLSEHRYMLICKGFLDKKKQLWIEKQKVCLWLNQ